MELKDTVEMMLSDDYKERLKGEFYQVKIRHEKLLNIIANWENPNLGFTPIGTRADCVEQMKRMQLYMNILEYIAMNENITL